MKDCCHTLQRDFCFKMPSILPRCQKSLINNAHRLPALSAQRLESRRVSIAGDTTSSAQYVDVTPIPIRNINTE